MSPEPSKASASTWLTAAIPIRLSLFLSIVAMAFVFWGLLQLDLPLTRFMRSVHVPWLERTGDWLARLGSGAVLAGLSLLMLVVGRWRKQTEVSMAGWQGLIAHGAAALVTQLLKHSVGRPRPRMTHGGGFEFGPSFDSGLDSFPSGHASASFAVATVLAQRFPRFRWGLFSAATLIACSRIWRGSHFPTDVMTGVVIGVSVGLLAASPPSGWRSLFRRALPRLSAALVAGFALLWTTLGTNAGQAATRLLVAAGLLALLMGLGARWAMALTRRPSLRRPWPAALLGIGLACLTGAWQVAIPAAVAGLAWCLAATWQASGGQAQSDASSRPASRHPAIWTEIALTAAVLLAAFILRSLQGIVPLLA